MFVAHSEQGLVLKAGIIRELDKVICIKPDLSKKDGESMNKNTRHERIHSMTANFASMYSQSTLGRREEKIEAAEVSNDAKP